MNSIKAKWAALLAWCHNSETILLARAQVLLGIVLAVASATDVSAVISGTISWKQAAALIAWGVFQEVVRKYRMKV